MIFKFFVLWMLLIIMMSLQVGVLMHVPIDIGYWIACVLCAVPAFAIVFLDDDNKSRTK